MESSETHNLLRVFALGVAGRTLFGDRWHTPLARLLNVNDRSLRRWVSGERSVSDEVIQSLPALLRAVAHKREAEAARIRTVASTLNFVDRKEAKR